jgi:hypothetical protein
VAAGPSGAAPSVSKIGKPLQADLGPDRNVRIIAHFQTQEFSADPKHHIVEI